MAVRNTTRGHDMRAHIQNTLPQAQPAGAKQKTKPAMYDMDEFWSRFTIQNVVLYEPFVNRSLTGHYQEII